jgi:ankyrin repeat protein
MQGNRLSRSSQRHTYGRSTRKTTDPYFKAIEEGDLEQVTLLLAKKITENKNAVNDADEYNRTGLRVAAQKGHVHIMRFLISQDADINFDGEGTHSDKKGFDDRGSRRELPIHAAALNGSPEAILCLIEAGSSVKVKDGGGCTPLHHATTEGHLQAVITLCEHLADLDETTTTGDTALHIAIAYGHQDIALELIRRKANINKKSSENKSSFLLAFQKGLNKVIAALLQCLDEEDKIKPSTTKRSTRLGLDFQDSEGNTEIHHAAINGQVERIQQLCAYGADPHAINKRYRNALFLAARYGQTEAMICLHELKVNHTEKAQYDLTPLDVAFKRKHHDCVALLQAWPAPPEAEENVVGEKRSPDSSEAEESENDRGVTALQADNVDLNPSGDDLFLAMLSQIQKSAPSIEPTAHTVEPILDAEHAEVIEQCKAFFEQEAYLQDSDLTEFLNQLASTKNLDALSNLRTKSGQNILHMIAKFDPKALLFSSLKKFTRAQVERLIHNKTANGETLLHLACQFHHIPLFEFCTNAIEDPHVLLKMALSKTTDCGLTPFQTLCVASYDKNAHCMKIYFEAAPLVRHSIQRMPLSQYPIHEDIPLLMRRFFTVFGENDNVFDNALMLCLYSLNPKLIQYCLDSLLKVETKQDCILQPMPNMPINPLQFACALGDDNSLKSMLLAFSRTAEEICREQELLEWCDFTTIPREDVALRTQLNKILIVVTDLYRDKKNNFTNDFKVAILRKREKNKSLLSRSNQHGGGILISILLAEKHLPRKPDILLDLMEDMQTDLAGTSPRSARAGSYSPRHFPSPMVATSSDKPIQNKVPSEAELRGILLHRIFRHQCPEDLLQQMATLVLSTMSTPRFRTQSTSDEKILTFISTNFTDSPHRVLRVNHVLIILALFYQVTVIKPTTSQQPHLTEPQRRKQQLESQYIGLFTKEPNDILRKLRELYEYLHENDPQNADLFLEEIFKGNSLLRAGIIKLIPTEPSCIRETKSNFVGYIKQLFDYNKVPQADSSEPFAFP